MLLMQIAHSPPLNIFLVLHILLCLHPQWCSICPCQYELNVCQQHTDMWKQTQILTFLWKVPSKAATMIVFPKLAISSQNSTVSGNYNNTKEAQI